MIVAFENFIYALGNELWSKWVLIALLGTGIIVLFATSGIQKYLGLALKKTFKSYFKGTKAEKDQKEVAGNISLVKALFTALSSSIGVGNVVGVGTAIAMGGPGAVLWMWISGLLGMGLKYAEVVLSLVYREQDENGIYRGGPMYVYKNGLHAKWAGYIFAIIISVVSLISLNMVQIGSAASSLKTAFNIPPIVTGIIATIIVALVILGGLDRLSKAAYASVSVMTTFFVAGGLIVLILNITKIPGAIALIFKSGLTGQAAVGGFAGSTIMAATRYGVARGLLANEAGCGSAPMAHSTAKAKHPCEQGLYGISEVFIVSYIVCTFTALVILVTGVWKTGEDGVTLVVHAFSKNLGFVGEAIVAITIASFAVKTIFGGSWYGQTGMAYVAGTKGILPYKIVSLILCFIGSLLGSDFLFALTDTANGFAVLVNLVSVLLLIKVVRAQTKEYFSREDAKIV